METYIFLTNQYLPKPGATGLCMHQLAKNLANKGDNVWTVCYADGDEKQEYDGVKIKKISTPSYLNDNQSASDIKRKLQYFGSLYSKLIHINKYPLRSYSLVNNYVKAVREILPAGKVTIVASYTPLEATIAAVKIKEEHGNRIKIAYYSADTLSNEQGDDGILSAEYRTKRGTKWECELFDKYDCIFIMECHKKHYERGEFAKFKNKMSVVSFPLFNKIAIENKERINDEKIHLVYAGTLFKKLRNPEFINKILVELSTIADINVTFLGGGDCEDLMRKAEEDSKNSIQFIGMQPHNVAMEYISSADILLSIGNVESPMSPSKIYEYMHTWGLTYSF